MLDLYLSHADIIVFLNCQNKNETGDLISQRTSFVIQSKVQETTFYKGLGRSKTVSFSF